MKRYIIILTFLLLTPIIVFVVINGRDESFEPKVEALLSMPIRDVADNVYPYLLGFGCGPEQDPQASGWEIIQIHEGGEKKEETDKFTVKDVGNVLCNVTKADCLSGYRDYPQTVYRILADNQLWLQRYRQLIHHKHYACLVSFSLEGPFPPFGVVRDAQRLLQAQIVLDPLMMTDGLEEEIEFWRMVLSQPTDLITKMLAVESLKSTYSFLGQILEKHPELQSRFKKQFRPLDKDEKSLTPSLEYEFVAMANIILALEYAPDTENVDGLPFFLGNKLLRKVSFSFYKKNATVNQYYHYFNKLERAIPQGAAAMKAVYQEEVEESTKKLAYVYNPIGKIILNIGITPMHSYQKRIEDLDSLITELIN